MLWFLLNYLNVFNFSVDYVGFFFFFLFGELTVQEANLCTQQMHFIVGCCAHCHSLLLFDCRVVWERLTTGL